MPLFGEHFGRPAPDFMVPSGLESGYTVKVPANYGTLGDQPLYNWWLLRSNIRWTTNPHKLTHSEVAADNMSDIRNRKRVSSRQIKVNPSQTRSVSFTPATTTSVPSRGLFKTAA